MAEPLEVDVVVLGAGTAGMAVAAALARGGVSVAVVESGLAGGAAAYWADTPLHALRGPGAVLLAAQSTPGAAQAVTSTLNAAATLARRTDLTGHWQDSAATAVLESAGVALLRGRGRISAARTVSVARLDGASQDLHAALAVVLATGSVPDAPGPAAAAAGPLCWGTRAALSAPALPRRLGVLGAGPNASAVAQAFARLGTGVTVLAPEGLLPGWPGPAVALVGALLRADGVQLWNGVGLAAASLAEGGLVLSLDNGHSLRCDALLVDTVRRPAVHGIGLERLGLVGAPLDGSGLAGGTDWLYCAGDAAADPLADSAAAFSTPWALEQARRTADAILARAGGADAAAVPEALGVQMVFTDPPLAATGMALAAALEAGFSAVESAGTAEADSGQVPAKEAVWGSLVVDADTGLLLGAAFAGSHAGDLAQLAAVGIVGRIPVPTLLLALPPAPSAARLWQQLLRGFGL
ncbi:FAD-dependent oxidoreductase [Pseudarthrobacter sp. P1]|uniref:FAD-dependent oxidoreductase n=1 Tax=Pseudarthrobacter sp. P1 TaxID=3418418 RepID=UPI003CE6E814